MRIRWSGRDVLMALWYRVIDAALTLPFVHLGGLVSRGSHLSQDCRNYFFKFFLH